MKIIDNFLKKLGISRNTFATYVFTLITIYLAVDRITEMLLMLFTGVSYSYWGPIQYTIALACPMLAFAFSIPSEFASTKKKKVTLFNIYVIGLSIIAISMFTQWLNMGAWLLLVFNPGYVDLVTDFSDLVRPALTSLTILAPVLIIPKVFNFLYFGVNDSKDMTQSIWDYGGIDLSDKKQGHGPYTCDVYLCQNSETSEQITIPEASRYQSMFVCGASGSGKTSLVYEPLIARDLEKKFFFREVAKEMGFTALKTGIATLTKPYDNEYLNANFNLNMLVPTSGNEDVYKGYMKKMILDSTSEITYKNCGVTVMSPDREISDHMIDVCKNLGLTYNIIDPTDRNSIGLNPFVYDDANKIAITISSVLKTMLEISKDEPDETYRESVVLQAIENVSILLKEMYPRMNEGMLPNLKDMLEMFTNFDLVEKMCEILAHDDELKEKYSTQLAYFKKNFYKTGINRQNTEIYIDAVITQLDKLLRLPGVKSILCNRHNNIDFDKMLANGDITFVCTRRGDLGASSHKAFGLFFLISMQNAVLRRPGSEKSRVPNFLYIDEFSDFISDSTEPIFTLYRKYRVGSVISVQNLDQLNAKNNKYRKTIIANCAYKVVFGNNVPEDNDWWSKELGEKSKWSYSRSYDTAKGEYSANLSGIKNEKVAKYKPGKIQTIKFKQCIYKVRDSGGKSSVGIGSLNFIEAKYNEKQPVTNLNFAKFTNGMSDDNPESAKKKIKKNVIPTFVNDDDSEEELDPIRSSNFDSIFDNADEGDAIISPTNKKNKKNNN